MTVVRAGDGEDIARAVAEVESLLRHANYDVAVETPDHVIGYWSGTYIVPETEACDASACLDAVAAALRTGGFKPGRNEKRSISAKSTERREECRYHVYVGFAPRGEGQFILY